MIRVTQPGEPRTTCWTPMPWPAGSNPHLHTQYILETPIDAQVLQQISALVFPASPPPKKKKLYAFHNLRQK